MPSFTSSAKPGIRRVTVSDMIITDIYGGWGVGERGVGDLRRRTRACQTVRDSHWLVWAALHLHRFARRHSGWRGERLKICKDIMRFKNTLERGDCDMQLLVSVLMFAHMYLLTQRCLNYGVWYSVRCLWYMRVERFTLCVIFFRFGNSETQQSILGEFRKIVWKVEMLRIEKIA
jgi:hypothetical protein